MTVRDNRPDLTLFRGGRLSAKEFLLLPINEQVDYLHMIPAEARFGMIIESDKPEALVAALPPQDIYQMLHDLGDEGGEDVIHLATPEQLCFILDWELWDKWSISLVKTMKWLDLILSTDAEKAARILSDLDQEILLLILKKCVAVGGGVSEILNSEDYQEEWDHTFDESYFLKFRLPEYSQQILQMIDLIYRYNPILYRSLMIGVENELESELEELAGQFRINRLADEGFPSPEEAAALYVRISPDSFVVANDKLAAHEEAHPPMPTLSAAEGSLLIRAFTSADTPALRREFQYLMNSALVAEGLTPADHQKMGPVVERIGNYLNLALEYLSEDDEKEGARILGGEHLKRLFTLGHSLLAKLQDRAGGVESDNYAADKLLMGLRMRRPRFYRGLDSDMVDNYREFTGMADFRVVDRFLTKMEKG
jgi:hypothetical protein